MWYLETAQHFRPNVDIYNHLTEIICTKILQIVCIHLSQFVTFLHDMLLLSISLTTYTFLNYFFYYMPFQYSKKHTLTEEFSKRVRMIYDHLFVTLYKKSIYSSGHKQRIRYHQNPFREFPCISKYNKSIRRCLNKDCTYNTNTGLFEKVYRTIFHNLLMKETTTCLQNRGHNMHSK